MFWVCIRRLELRVRCQTLRLLTQPPPHVMCSTWPNSEVRRALKLKQTILLEVVDLNRICLAPGFRFRFSVFDQQQTVGFSCVSAIPINWNEKDRQAESKAFQWIYFRFKWFICWFVWECCFFVWCGMNGRYMVLQVSAGSRKSK